MNAQTTHVLVFPKRGAAIFTNKVRIAREPVILDPNVMGWRVSIKHDIKYVAYALLVRKLFDLADVSTVPQINNKHIYPAKFPVPPLAEQSAIVSHIESLETKFDGLLSAYTRQLELLMEYRAALIHECVTGQRAVPESFKNTNPRN